MAGHSERGSSRAVLVALVVAPLVLAVVMLAPALAQVGGTAAATARAPASPEVMKWGFMAAALVTGLSAIGAAYAVAVVGGAAMGAVAEKPETAGRALVFVGLAEGIAIYGLIIAIMILGYL
ncbi:MAG: ATP synthase subunit C [Acidobacteriia bacterium]|nr:ATP synthase subunit C [Terriglobia bacterium]